MACTFKTARGWTSLAAGIALVVAFLITGGGRAQAAPAAPATGSGGDSIYTPISPLRALDTRINLGATGPVGANKTIRLTVGGNGVPTTGVVAVAINLTITAPQRGGFLVAYPDGINPPTSSSLNFRAGQTVANMAIVAVGDDGQIAIANHSAGTVQIVADISGYFTGPSPIGGPGYYVPLAPKRALDTRISVGAPGPIPAGATITLVVAGGGVPATNVGAVAMNLTVVSPSTGGYVTAYPDLTSPPSTSSVNFPAGQTTANFGIITVGADGVVKITNHSRGPIQLVGDISGYVWAGANSQWLDGWFAPVYPARVLDTRIGTGASGPIPPGGSINLSLASVGGLPPRNFGAVALNLTATAPTRIGYITAYPAGAAAPTSSALNFGAGQTVANLAIVKVPATGQITLVNHSTGSVQLVADVSGYFYTSYWSNLTVSVSGPGSVTGSPGAISCPSACSNWYLNGTSISLTPVPALGANFTGWVNGCGIQGSCTVTPPASVRADFQPEGGLAPGQVGTVHTNFFGKTAVCVTNLDNTHSAAFNGKDQPLVGAVSLDGTLSPGQTNCGTLDRGWVGYDVLVTNTSATADGSHIAACVLQSGQSRCPG